MRVPKCSRQPREQRDPELNVGIAERCERLFEQGHEPLVFACAHPDDTAAVADRRTGELARVPELPRDLGAIEKGAFRSRSVPSSHLRLAEREEKLTARPLVGWT